MGQVLGVAQQHGGVFLGASPEVDREPGVNAERGEEQATNHDIG